MAKSGGSSSSSTNTTSTTTQDNKVSATDSAIALGNEAQFSYSDQFPDNVKEAFNELVGLVRDAGQAAQDFASKAIQANESSVQKVQETSQAAIDAVNLKDQALLKSLIPYVGIASIIFAFSFVKGGKKK